MKTSEFPMNPWTLSYRVIPFGNIGGGSLSDLSLTITLVFPMMTRAWNIYFSPFSNLKAYLLL